MAETEEICIHCDGYGDHVYHGSTGREITEKCYECDGHGYVTVIDFEVAFKPSNVENFGIF